MDEEVRGGVLTRHLFTPLPVCIVYVFVARVTFTNAYVHVHQFSRYLRINVNFAICNVILLFLFFFLFFQERENSFFISLKLFELPWHFGVPPVHFLSAPHLLVRSPTNIYPYLHSYDTTELYDTDVKIADPNSGFSGVGHCTAVTTLEPNPTKSNSILQWNFN